MAGMFGGFPDVPSLEWLQAQVQDASLTTSVAIACSSIALALLLRTQLSGSSKAKRSGATSPTISPSSARSTSASITEPCLMGTIIPSNGLLLSNPEEPYEFENENCYGLFVPLHRPTLNPALDKSCEYRFGDHFKGRKRLWEIRLQLRFKKKVELGLRLGVELEAFVPLNAGAQKLMQLTVAALRRVAGSDLYHSIGDDPTKGDGPHEKPVFMMPLWACDQMIVTPEGEEAPSLCDPQLSNYGDLRTADRKAFVQAANDLVIEPGPTYTFVFWGISQFLDCIKWEVQKVIPFKSIDFNQFCGKPPVSVVFYTLSDPETPGETRHLQSRKNYYFRYTMWSSEKRPSAAKIRELIPKEALMEQAAHQEQSAEGLQQRKNGNLSKIFTCCTGSRSN